MRGIPASLKSFMITLLCMPDLPVGTTATRLENLNAIGVDESRFMLAEVKLGHSTTKGKVGVVIVMDSRVKEQLE